MSSICLHHLRDFQCIGEIYGEVREHLKPGGVFLNLDLVNAPTPDLERVRESLEGIVADGHRAGDVISRIRQLATRSDPQKVPVEVNDVIRDVVPLIDSEVRGHDVDLRLDLTPAPALVAADRVQLQQVVINLALNGIEAMSTSNGRPRELVIPVSDMTCEGCEATLRDKLVNLEGVIEVAPSHEDKQVRVVVDGWSGPKRDVVEQTIRRAGYTVAE